MTIGFPHFTHSAKQGELGVSIVSRIISDTFGWLFKRNHQEHDFGIDGQIELVSEAGAVTGQMLAMQIKCGKSFFKEQSKWGFIYRGEKKHFNYLANYPIPVLICISEPDSKETYWVKFQAEKTQVTENGWKIIIPFENKLDVSKEALINLVKPLSDSLSKLESYWLTNRFIEESSIIVYVIDKSDVETFEIARIRAFFDRLLVTKELAFECLGKVEISFFGYDEDPKELYEIEEIRRYVSALDKVLDELFFFSNTESPSHMLILFALCQMNISLVTSETVQFGKKEVSFDTEEIIDFFGRHCVGLNRMTDWLNMSLEENKAITFAVLKCLGLDFPKL